MHSVMPGVAQDSPTIDRAYSGWGEATTVCTQPVTREVEMDNLIIKSSSTLGDKDFVISDEGVPLIDQWPRRINMEDENIQVSRAMDSAADPIMKTSAPNQEDCFNDNTLDWLKGSIALWNRKPLIKYDHRLPCAMRNSLYRASRRFVSHRRKGGTSTARSGG